ncbi:hypothetical protein QQM79_02920 [Marinobacteraceae bacterium S3BR75-40.1]
MTAAHKAGNNEGFLVRRHLRVQNLDESAMSELAETLLHNPSVDHLAFNADSGKVDVTYDASHWSVDRFIEAVQERGGDVTRNGWQRMKLGWYRFTDENVQANAKHEPFCCSKIPPMKRK